MDHCKETHLQLRWSTQSEHERAMECDCVVCSGALDDPALCILPCTPTLHGPPDLTHHHNIMLSTSVATCKPADSHAAEIHPPQDCNCIVGTEPAYLQKLCSCHGSCAAPATTFCH